MNTGRTDELTIVRNLDAPRDNVWRACRDVDALKHWWGMPSDAVMVFCDVDFRVGGALHFATTRHKRPRIWFKCIYKDIVEGVRLVVTQHRSDELGYERDSPEWPASTIALRLDDMSGKTKLTVTHSGMISARATLDDYRQGWSETLDRLETLMARR